MARLTKQVKDGYFVLNCDACEMKGENCTPMGCLQVATKRLAAYEETLLEPKEVAGLCAMDKRSRMAKMLRWEEAEQDGRLVVLPSKTVWELTMDAGPDCDLKCPVDAYDEALGCDLCSKAKPFAYERPCTQERLKGLGKTVFLTREEAEAAMKEANHA